MLKVLSFTGEQGVKRFEILWQAFCLSAGGDGAKRSFETQRREAKIAVKLEGISVAEAGKTLQTGDTSRMLEGNPDLVLEQADLELLRKAVENLQWRPTATPFAVDVVDWLSSAPEPQQTDAVR